MGATRKTIRTLHNEFRRGIRATAVCLRLMGNKELPMDVSETNALRFVKTAANFAEKAAHEAEARVEASEKPSARWRVTPKWQFAIASGMAVTVLVMSIVGNYVTGWAHFLNLSQELPPSMTIENRQEAAGSGDEGGVTITHKVSPETIRKNEKRVEAGRKPHDRLRNEGLW